VMQPIFLYELGKNFREYLDEDRLGKVYPLKSILDFKINLALSTDAPVVNDFNPLKGIQCAVERKDANGNEIGGAEKISVDDAIYAYTLGSAAANDDEESRGRISRGKVADFVVVNKNAVESRYLSGLKVETTFLHGILECDNRVQS
ncbi:MAG: amidohydrolase family protein, partial [Chitinophagales bacterium]